MKHVMYGLITGLVVLTTISNTIGVTRLQRENYQQQQEIETLKVEIAATKEREKRWVEILSSRVKN